MKEEKFLGSGAKVKKGKIPQGGTYSIGEGHHRVASAKTCSYKILLNSLEPSVKIYELSAKSTVNLPTKTDTIFPGLYFREEKRNSFRQNTKLNPSRGYNVEDLLVELDGKFAEYGLEDAAIEKISIGFRDKEMEEKIEELFNLTIEDEFIATLVNKPAERDEVKKKIKEINRNEELVEDFGFKYRCLNVVQCINKKQLLSLPRRKRTYFINWKNEDKEIGEKELRSPHQLSRIVKKKLGEVGMMKSFEKSEEETLVLVGVE